MLKTAIRICSIVSVQWYLTASVQGSSLDTTARNYIDQMTKAYQNYFEARQTIESYNQGMSLARSGDCPAALIFLGSFLDQVKVLQPRLFVAAHRNVSNCYRQLGHLENSIDHWQNAVRIQSQFTNFNSTFIRESITSMLPTLVNAPSRKRHEVALFLSEILALDWPIDSESEIAYTVGLLHYQNGNRKALKQLKPVLRLLKDPPKDQRRIALQRAILGYVVGDPPNNNADIIKAVAGSPPEEKGQFLLVQARLQAFSNRLIDALELFGSVPKDSDYYPHALVESTQVLLMIGRPKQANRQIQIFLDEYTGHERTSDARKLLLLSHLRLGDSSPTRNLLTSTNTRLQDFLRELDDLVQKKAPPARIVAETRKVNDLIQGHPALSKYLVLEQQKNDLFQSLQRLKDRRTKYLADLQDSRFVPNIEKQTFLFNNLYRMANLLIEKSENQLKGIEDVLEELSPAKAYIPVLKNLRERRNLIKSKMTSDPFELITLAKYEAARNTLSSLKRRLASVEIRVGNLKFANELQGNRLTIVLSDLQTRITEITATVEAGALATARKSDSVFGAHADILEDHWQSTNKALEVVAQLPISDHDLIQVHPLAAKKIWTPVEACFKYLISEFRRHESKRSKQLQRLTANAGELKAVIERLADKIKSIEHQLNRHFVTKQNEMTLYYQQAAKQLLAENNKSLVDLDWIDIETEDFRRQRLIKSLEIKKLVELAKQADIEKLKISL